MQEIKTNKKTNKNPTSFFIWYLCIIFPFIIYRSLICKSEQADILNHIIPWWHFDYLCLFWHCMIEKAEAASVPHDEVHEDFTMTLGESDHDD